MLEGFYLGGIVRDGAPVWDRPKLLNAALAEYEGQRIVMGIWRDAEARSLVANAWYWCVLVKAYMDLTGLEKDEAHAEIKRRFLEIDPAIPACIGTPTTTTLTGWQFRVLCDRVARFLAEHGSYIPLEGTEAFP